MSKEEREPGKIWSGSIVFLFIFPLLSLPVHAEKDIDFQAEHLLESQMDSQYLNLLGKAGCESISVSVSGQKAGLLKYRDIEFSIGRTLKKSESYQLGYVGFLGLAELDGNIGTGIFNPLFLQDKPFDTPFKSTFSPGSGSFSHLGLGLSLSRVFKNGTTLSLLLLGENLNVSKFQVQFKTPDGNPAEISYDATYHFLTPGFEYQKESTFLGKKCHYRAGFWIPRPNVGFRAKLVYNSHVYEGDTQQAGYGSHMGDPFVGGGFGIQWGHLEIDLGVSAYLLLAESQIHKGVGQSLHMKFTYHFNSP